jgi:hypothetical protein
LRFDQMVMIVRPDGWADTQRICPDGRAREGAIWSNPFGAGRYGALAAPPSRADTARYLPGSSTRDHPHLGPSNVTSAWDRTPVIDRHHLQEHPHERHHRQHDRGFH